ncbi:Ubiquinol-cytochrome C reductase, cytochrome C1 subunit [hydrothermal vent metagenome]|uniref:Ubiquinol-cytochrome C reductase, cytochrome C1 subunit n=1 Tax=hydrothermal vent metagenome TaxID=652676 RepID=A0A3B1AH80_9ZZZZ
MKKLLIISIFTLFPLLANASGGGHLDKVDIDLSNKESLQSGAKIFVNYCLSCHSASYMRYNRMAVDLNMSTELVEKNLMFASDKIGSTMDVAMDKTDAKSWFGTTPPDLSVIARSRSPEWLYTYFRTFYLDESRPFGVNNALFKDVGMPHVLWELEGTKQAIFEEKEDHDGSKVKEIVGYKEVTKGSRTKVEYDNDVKDLVAFLDYMGEPAKTERKALGVWVLIYLFILFLVSYAMKKEFWKDVH